MLHAAESVTILSLIVLTLLAQMLLVGALKHAREQSVGYGRFRADLANAVAPSGQYDVVTGSLLKVGAPVAVLDIPRLDIHHEVVGEGTTSGVLQRGPGHRRNSVLPGQLGVSVIFGKAYTYGAPFRRIPSLKAGDAIDVTTGQGKHTYEVIDVRRAGDPIPPFTEGESRLTLVTATGPWYAPGGAVRVDARLTSHAVPSPAQMAIPVGSTLPDSEQPLRGDGSAWFALMLWSQGLLLAVAAVVWTRSRWGRWQTWIAGAPLLLALGLAVADQATRLFPNLI